MNSDNDGWTHPHLLILAAVAGLCVVTPSRVPAPVSSPGQQNWLVVTLNKSINRWRAPLTNSPHLACQLYLCEYETLTKHSNTLTILMIKNSSTYTDE